MSWAFSRVRDIGSEGQVSMPPRGRPPGLPRPSSARPCRPPQRHLVRRIADAARISVPGRIKPEGRGKMIGTPVSAQSSVLDAERGRPGRVARRRPAVAARVVLLAGWWRLVVRGRCSSWSEDGSLRSYRLASTASDVAVGAWHRTMTIMIRGVADSGIRQPQHLARPDRTA